MTTWSAGFLNAEMDGSCPGMLQSSLVSTTCVNCMMPLLSMVFFWWVLVFFFGLIFVISSVFMHYVLGVLSEWLFLGSPWKSWSLLWIVPAVIFLYSNIIVLDMKCSWMEKPANCQLCACHQFCTVSSFLIQCVNWGLMSVIVKNDMRMLCDLLIFCLFQLCFWVLKPIPGYH